MCVCVCVCVYVWRISFISFFPVINVADWFFHPMSFDTPKKVPVIVLFCSTAYDSHSLAPCANTPVLRSFQTDRTHAHSQRSRTSHRESIHSLSTNESISTGHRIYSIKECSHTCLICSFIVNRYEVRVGSSDTNTKTVQLHRADFDVLPMPINEQQPSWSNRFSVDVDGT